MVYRNENTNGKVYSTGDVGVRNVTPSWRDYHAGISPEASGTKACVAQPNPSYDVCL